MNACWRSPDARFGGVEEPVDSPNEAVEGRPDRDNAELARLEDDVAAIEEAMDRIEQGDFDGYDALAMGFDERAETAPSSPVGTEEAV